MRSRSVLLVCLFSSIVGCDAGVGVDGDAGAGPDTPGDASRLDAPSPRPADDSGADAVLAIDAGSLPTEDDASNAPDSPSDEDGSVGVTSDASSSPDAASSGPVGVADDYATFTDSPLAPDAPGVLANDGGSATRSVLVSDVAHGTLALLDDGSFRYVPESGFAGDDGFVYAPAEGASVGAPTAVTIHVRPSAVERTLVILAYDPASTFARPAPSEIEARMAIVSRYFAELSYGAVRLGGVLHPDRPADVMGWYESSSTACFDLAEYMRLADADGVDFTAYTRLVVVLGQRPGCTLSAWGSFERVMLPSPDGIVFLGWVRMSVPNAGITTLTHELGHTLRNGHANFLDCGAVSWAASGCRSVEYGDPYDLMASRPGFFSARRLDLMGWLHPERNRVLEVTRTGDYVIEPLETNTGGIKALRIPRGGDFPVYVEYRQPIGLDASFGASADVYTGVLLHVSDNILDATPPAAMYGPGQPTDAQLTPALHVGASWVDPLTGTTITLTARTGTSAFLHVEIPGS